MDNKNQSGSPKVISWLQPPKNSGSLADLTTQGNLECMKIKASGLSSFKIQGSAGAGLRTIRPLVLASEWKENPIARPVAMQPHSAPCWEKWLTLFVEQWVSQTLV